jgi:hypothetical protein
MQMQTISYLVLNFLYVLVQSASGVEEFYMTIKDLRDFGHLSGTRGVLVGLVLSTLVNIAMLGVVTYFTAAYAFFLRGNSVRHLLDKGFALNDAKFLAQYGKPLAIVHSLLLYVCKILLIPCFLSLCMLYEVFVHMLQQFLTFLQTGSIVCCSV